MGTTPLAIEVITPQANIIEWANLPSRDGGEPGLSILLRTKRLVLGETPLQVSKTAINILPDEFNASFDGLEMAGLVSRTREGPTNQSEHLILPEGRDP